MIRGEEALRTIVEPVLETKRLSKWFGDFQVLRAIEFDVHRGQVLVIVGPSGSGKSTLLRCINYLEPFQEGEIRVLGERLVGTREQTPADTGKLSTLLRRLRPRVGMVFQRLNLFPHLTVLDNITIGPVTVRGVSEEQAKTSALSALARIGLSEKASRYPRELSGGQQQRVAIARALVMQSELLLLDEITSSLDPELIGEVLKVIKELADAGQTMVIVTHEMEFAKDVATSVLMMDHGAVVEQGPPEKIFRHPDSPRTQRFLAQVIEKHRAVLDSKTDEAGARG
jgi:ABC-type polar amino acid transport system ATPase subunit